MILIIIYWYYILIITTRLDQLTKRLYISFFRCIFMLPISLYINESDILNFYNVSIEYLLSNVEEYHHDFDSFGNFRIELSWYWGIVLN